MDHLTPQLPDALASFFSGLSDQQAVNLLLIAARIKRVVEKLFSHPSGQIPRDDTSHGTAVFMESLTRTIGLEEKTAGAFIETIARHVKQQDTKTFQQLARLLSDATIQAKAALMASIKRPIEEIGDPRAYDAFVIEQLRKLNAQYGAIIRKDSHKMLSHNDLAASIDAIADTFVDSVSQQYSVPPDTKEAFEGRLENFAYNALRMAEYNHAEASLKNAKNRGHGG